VAVEAKNTYLGDITRFAQWFEYLSADLESAKLWVCSDSGR